MDGSGYSQVSINTPYGCPLKTRSALSTLSTIGQAHIFAILRKTNDPSILPIGSHGSVDIRIATNRIMSCQTSKYSISYSVRESRYRQGMASCDDIHYSVRPDYIFLTHRTNSLTFSHDRDRSRCPAAPVYICCTSASASAHRPACSASHANRYFPGYTHSGDCGCVAIYRPAAG